MSSVVKRLLGAAIAALLGIGVAVVATGSVLGASPAQGTLRLAAHAGIAGDATNADDSSGTTSTSANGETTTTSGGETDTSTDTSSTDTGTTDTDSTDTDSTDTTTTSGVSGQGPSEPNTTGTTTLCLLCTTTVTSTITLPGTTSTETQTRTNTQTSTQTNTQTNTQTVTSTQTGRTVTGPGGTQTITSPGGTTTVVSPPTTQTVTTRQPTSTGPRGYVASLMSWTFAYTRRYTTIASLAVTGLATGSTLSVSCTGGGCPFVRESADIVAKCVRADNGRKRRCTHPTSLRLSPMFHQRHLAAGARVVVTITHRRWVGKYYRFGMRAGRTPTVLVSCLAPGGSTPGKACTAR